MTRSGHACALAIPGYATAATGCSSSPISPGRPHGWPLLPTPVAGNFNDGESIASWTARRDRQKLLGRNGNGIGTPLTIAVALLPTPMAHDTSCDRFSELGGQRPSGAKRQIGLPEIIVHRLGGEGRLLPTPDTGVSPRGHGRRGGRPGNGRQSGQGLDAAARALASGETDWGEYEPAIRRHERVTGCPVPVPSEPGPKGQRLAAVFAEWMMGLPPGHVTAVPGLPRTAQLRLLGNGVVPRQAGAALRLLIEVAAAPAAQPGGAATARGHQ